MTFSHALATNNYGEAKFIVDPSAANGTHTTIAAALTSASSGDTIFIRQGTYTENITLKAGVNLCAYGPTSAYSIASAGGVIINGTCTMTTAGTVGIKGIVLQTNGATAALAVTGSAASIVQLENCYLNCTGNTGVTFSSSSASAQIQFEYCSGDITTTGIALFSHSSAGSLRFLHCTFSNSGVSTTNNTVSAGGFYPNYSGWSNGTTISNAATLNGSHLDLTMSGNQIGLTTTDTATVVIIHATFTSGTSSAITLGSGTSMQLHHALISSSNAAPIAGSGTINFSSISFNSVVNISSTVAHSGVGVDYGNWNLIQTLSASTSANLEFKNLATTYSLYAIIINNIAVATAGANLQMTVSADNGGSYAASGYNTGINRTLYNSATVTNANATTFAMIGDTVQSQISGKLLLTPGNGLYVGQVTYFVNGSTFCFANCGGGTAVVFNAFKFAASSGNLTSGSISLYGISA